MQLNEGLEKLGEKEVINGREYEGAVFYETAIEAITLPSTLKRLEKKTFSYCHNLKQLEIPDGVEYIGERCFSYSGIKKIMLPRTLNKISKDTFKDCTYLKTVFVKTGCAVDVKWYTNYNVKVHRK